MKIIAFILFIATITQFNVESQFVVKRIDVTKCDDRYFAECKAGVVRYGRRSEYYSYLETTLLQLLGNNVTIHFRFDEYLHNEYRPSFVHSPFCDHFNKDNYFGAALRADFARAGYPTCPFKPGYYKVENMTIPPEILNFVWPFQKARIEVMFEDNVIKKQIGSLYAYVEISNTRKAIKSSDVAKLAPLD